MIDIIAINTQQLNNADKPVLVDQDQPKLKSNNLNQTHLQDHQDPDLHREDKEQLILRSKY